MKSKDQAVASFEALEIKGFQPHDPPSFVLPWDSCADLKLPTTSCKDFPCQRITPEDKISNGEALIGLCIPNQGNPQHPNETEWPDFSCTDGVYHEASNVETIGIFAGVISGALVLAKFAKTF
jgi:hypothetical protein